MVFFSLWALLAYLALCSADSDSGSNESGGRKHHKKHRHHSEFLPHHGYGNSIYPTLPSPGGYHPHNYNHPAYPVPNQPLVIGWHAPPPLGYNYPVFGGPQPHGYYGPPHGPPHGPPVYPPFYGHQPYGYPPPSGGYNPNIGYLPPQAGGPHPASNGFYPNSINQQPLPGNNVQQNRQPQSPVGPQPPSPGGYYPPPTSSSSSSSSSSSVINQQPSPPASPQPPQGLQPATGRYSPNQPNPGEYVHIGYLLNNPGPGQSLTSADNGLVSKPCDTCL